MYSTTAYLYQQKTRVIMIDTSGAYFTLRYEPVYAKRLTINKGVDNVILFEFINQDQKPVNITGSTMTFRLVSQNGLELLLEEPMEILNAQYGRAKVTIPQADLNAIRAQPANYSITRASGNLYEPVFTDAAAGASAPVDVVDSIYPEFIPSAEVTIPTVNLPASGTYGAGGGAAATYPDWAQNPGAPINSYSPLQSTEYFTSFIEPTGPITTVQMDLVGYTGTIKAQAAQNYQSDWYDISESWSYSNYTGTIHKNLIGWHPIMRLGFNNSVWTTGINGASNGYPAQVQANVVDGVVVSATILNPGFGYAAPPKLVILGNGAGATAEATIGANGVLTSVNIITGGSGYRPNPPTGICATVLVTTGFIENILYR